MTNGQALMSTDRAVSVEPKFLGGFKSIDADLQEVHCGINPGFLAAECLARSAFICNFEKSVFMFHSGNLLIFR
jgi:hypothetical protein